MLNKTPILKLKFLKIVSFKQINLNKISTKFNNLSLWDKNTIAFQVVILLLQVKTFLETIKNHKTFKGHNLDK